MRKKIAKEWVRRNAALLLLPAVIAVNLAVFALYELPMEPFGYGTAILIAVAVTAAGISWLRIRKEAEKQERLAAGILSQWKQMPNPENLTAAEYQQMIGTLGRRMEELETEYEQGRTEMTDYYTTWVHQIKTPIAVMRMMLSQNDTEENRALNAELFRIEQYVEMVLQYIRLDARDNDLVIREYDLDELIRQAIRKYAPQFVGRKLKLVYEGTRASVVVDAKWFGCILEQILSNAVKYTPGGGVTVRFAEGKLSVTDTGIGISPEDLPRIFEKGYTGNNGRLEQKSSGLGLFLCKKAADKLAIPIGVKSKPGEGTTFVLDLSEKTEERA